MPNGAELRKKDPKMVEFLDKRCQFTRGLRKRRMEELTGPFGLPRIPAEGELNKGWDVIEALQRTSSAEHSSFAKDSTKATEGSPKKSATAPLVKLLKPRKTLRRGFGVSST